MGGPGIAGGRPGIAGGRPGIAGGRSGIAGGRPRIAMCETEIAANDEVAGGYLAAGDRTGRPSPTGMMGATGRPLPSCMLGAAVAPSLVACAGGPRYRRGRGEPRAYPDVGGGWVGCLRLPQFSE
jgi:hypothetical protein